MNIDKRLLAYKPISVTLNFDWENTTYDERVLARHNYIEEQKKKDPNYVGWDFPEHFRSTHGGRTEDLRYSVTFDLLISTLGLLVSARYEDKLFTTFGGKSHKGYLVTAINEPEGTQMAQVHRIVACTFNPLPEDLIKDPGKAIINHKNDVVTCNQKSNLEWTTLRGNTIKAVETGLIPTTLLKYTITQPGPLLGNVYYFHGKLDFGKCGFSHQPALESARTGKQYLCGVWTEITKEELKDKPRGIPEEDLAIIRDKKFGRQDALPAVGTIVTDGPCKGEQFVLYGLKEIEKYGINSSSVSAATKGKLKIVAACTWERMTREEAANIPAGLTPEQLDHINKTRLKKNK